MNEFIPIQVLVQIEKYEDQFVRARPLGPWKLQVVGPNWDRIERTVAKRLEKLLPRALPTDLFAGGFVSEQHHWTTTLEIRPPRRDVNWLQPVKIHLDSFRWMLSNGNALAIVPAVRCTLFAKPDELTEEFVAKQANVALLRLTENTDLQRLKQRFLRRSYDFVSLSLSLPIGGLSSDKSKKKADQQKISTLRETASDLLVAELGEVYGLDDRAIELSDYFVGDSPQSVLLVGPSGVGKTSVLYRFVKLLLAGKLPLETRRPVWSTSGARIVSGMSGLGMWQERCAKLIRQAHATGAILHLGSLFELSEAGKIDGQPGVASMVRQAIARGKLLAVAECTAEQLAIVERDDPMLVRAFAKLELKELDQPKIRGILRAAADVKSRPQHLTITDQAIEELVRLHSRFATYSALPATALRLLQTICEDHPPGATVDAVQVARAFAKQTGLPTFLVDDSISIDLQSLSSQLSEQVVGQSEPVELIVNLIATLKARLVRPGRPLASLMFIGPTGVGKTEMAKAIARLLYSDTRRMIRIDMSEYSSPWSITKLIGRAGEGDGTLTSPIREQPFSVVLLDEFEKADPNVFDLLLQVLGEGRLTDAQGRLADFRNAVVIMTSNLGAETFRDAMAGFSEGETLNWREHFEREVRKFVRPEFLGRIDRIVPFRPLPKDVVRQIALRELDELRQRPGLKHRQAEVVVKDEAVDLLCTLGYEPRYGARPLRRMIEHHVAVPLADALSQTRAGDVWQFTIAAEDGKIVVQRSRLAHYNNTLAYRLRATIDSWQQLGRKARIAIASQPVRDLHNSIAIKERDEAEQLRAKSAATGQSLPVPAAPNSEAQRNRRLLNNLTQAVQTIEQRHRDVLVQWYRNADAEIQSLQCELQQLQNNFEAQLESVIIGRVAGECTVIVTGTNDAYLQFLWRMYHTQAQDKGWSLKTYALQPYEPRWDSTSAEFRKQVSQRKLNADKFEGLQPDCRLTSFLSDEPSQKLADCFAIDSLEEVPARLSQICGLALEFRGVGIQSWLELTQGIAHFVELSRSGEKKRTKFKINVFPTLLSLVHLPQNWRDPSATSNMDPCITVDFNLELVLMRSDFEMVGRMCERNDYLGTLLKLWPEAYAKWLDFMIGFEPIPYLAKLIPGGEKDGFSGSF